MRRRSRSETPCWWRRPTAAVALAAVCTAVLGGLATSAHAGGRDTAASAFAVRTVRLLVENRYAAAWHSLHPSHQRVVGGRRTYVQCELTAPILAQVIAVDALSVWDESVLIAGIGRVRTKAVAIRIALEDSTEPDGIAVTHSVHVLLVSGRWRWVLPNSRYASYSRGGCG
jgi:hypothetical protein